MIHDRTGASRFPILQIFLSEMLGLSRPSVSLAAEALQKGGAIKDSRGQMTILDRQKLEADTYKCYQIIQDIFTSLLSMK